MNNDVINAISDVLVILKNSKRRVKEWPERDTTLIENNQQSDKPEYTTHIITFHLERKENEFVEHFD